MLRLKSAAHAAGSLALALPLSAQSTSLVSVSSTGAQSSGYSQSPALSADGRVIAFESSAWNLAPGEAATDSFDNDIFVHDRLTGFTERASVDSNGIPANGESSRPSISADGRRISFRSAAADLVLGDTNGLQDIFVHDRATGLTTRVSVSSSGAQAAGGAASALSAISPDGDCVAFWSGATNLVPNDTNGMSDLFVHDLATGVTAAITDTTSGAFPLPNLTTLSWSADSRFLAFDSEGVHVPGDTNVAMDVFVHDRATGVTTRVSESSAGAQGNAASAGGSLSADGRLVAFFSQADNLSPGDTNGALDLFLHDRVTGLTSRVDPGLGGVQGNANTASPVLSADGLRLAFMSDASNLVAGDTNGVRDQFIFDRPSGTTTRVSVASNGVQANALSLVRIGLSADGATVSFASEADNLVPGDVNGRLDVFVHEADLAARLGTSYCGPASVHSLGTSARILAVGDPAATANDFTLAALELPPNELGYFLASRAQGLVTNPGGSQGDLCLALPIARFVSSISSSGAAGTFVQSIDLTAIPLTPVVAAQAGETWNFQAWFRDANPQPTSNFTDGVSVTFR